MTHPQSSVIKERNVATKPRCWQLASVIRLNGACGRLSSLLIAIALLFSVFAPGAAANPDVDQVQAAADWLATQQDDSGGFIGFSGEPDASLTADAVIALSAAQRVGAEVDLDSALDFLAVNGLVLAQTGPGSAAKFSLALSSAGIYTRDFGGVDPLSIVETSANSGMIGNGPFDHAVGLLALAAARSAVPEAAIDAALDSQLDDGSWSFDGSNDEGAGDTNTTALMVQALVANQIGDEAVVTAAVDYLLTAANDDGSFSYQTTLPGDSNSTALVVQALIALGDQDFDVQLQAAIDALDAFQNENGSISWMLEPRDDNMFSTVQGLPAMAQLAVPLPPLAESVSGDSTPAATPASQS